MHAQFETVRAGRSVDFGQLGAGLDANLSGLLPLDLVHRRHVEHDAAFERDALPVVAGGAAADGQRDAILGAGRGNPDDFAFVLWASAQTISDTVAAPIEQQINGVEDMLYMYSQATSNGQLTVTITFKLGTDLDKAQVLVQNRVAIAQPQLPDEVQRNGVVTKKNSPDILMVVFMLSPDDSLDQLYISNYALLQVRDQLLRLDGIGDIQIFGARDYSMRLWLDPDKIATLGMTAGEVVAAIRSQNVQIAGGQIAEPPIADRAFSPNLTFTGRLKDPKQFEEIVGDGFGRDRGP